MALDTLMLESAGAKRPFFFRKGTSDEAVLTQVFRHWHYRMDDWARHHEIKAVIEQRLADGRRPLIVDAGANIGASAVFFLLKIKSAKVIAIEPQAENFALLKRNLEGLNQLARCRSVQDFVAVHSRLVRESLQHMAEDGRTIAEISLRAMKDASKAIAETAPEGARSSATAA